MRGTEKYGKRREKILPALHMSALSLSVCLAECEGVYVCLCSALLSTLLCALLACDLLLSLVALRLPWRSCHIILHLFSATGA